MSTLKKSPARRTKYRCTACGQDRPPTLFLRDDPYHCTECKAQAQANDDFERLLALDDAGPAPQRRTPSLKITKLAEETPPQPTPGDESTPDAPKPAPAGDIFISPGPSADPANMELAARTLARRRLLPFIKRFKPKYDAGWVHEDICRRLEQFVADVEAGKEPRLLLMMPVRHGKSEIGSRHFAPWILGKHPDWEIIAASGAQSLAMSFSRYIRDLVRDPAYQSVFPHLKLDASSQSVENWNTTYGGGYLAAGIGTMITGRGAHVLLIDDPVKDAEAADSSVIRDSVWEWYMSTAYTRLAPGGGVLGIMTWWNEDDWAGRIQQVMATGEGDKFEIVKYPAINDLGDEYILADDTIEQIPPDAPVPEGARMTRPHNTALHPARYTLDMLLRRKSNYYALGQQRWWSALFQQNPAPEEGSFFTKDMFVEYVTPPRREGLNVYQAWDFAITEKQASDYTVGITVLVDESDNMYVLDVWRFRTEDGIEIASSIVQYARTWKATQIAVEDGQIWKSIKASFDKACIDAKYYPSYEVIVPLTDKRTRAQPARGRMQQKRIQFPVRAPWYENFRQELLRFQAGGKHDDQVDALAHVVRLATTKPAPRGIKRAAPPESDWRKKLRQTLRGGAGSSLAA
jgi:predicted phage terminase large subunit-like protein